jgi:hypothetical protein
MVCKQSDSEGFDANYPAGDRGGAGAQILAGWAGIGLFNRAVCGSL